MNNVIEIKGSKNKATKGNTAAPAKVAGVTMAKVSVHALRQAVVQVGLLSPNDAHRTEPHVLVAGLTEYFKKNTAAPDLADCDVCGGVSDVRLDACPFCGVGEGTDNGAAANSAEKEQANVATTTGTKGGKSKGKADKGAKAAKPNGAAAKAAKPPKAAIVKVPEALPVGVTVEKLDHAVADVSRLKGEAGVAGWALGKKIAEIYDGQLWKARTHADGTPMYKHWNQFCQGELNMVPGNAYNLMDVAKAFTADQVQALGTTKLGFILKAPPEAQPQLLEAAATHSKRELEKKVAAVKTGRRDTGRKATPAGVPGAKGLKSKKDNITVAAIAKKHTVPLFCKPERGQEPSKRARKLGDVPVGWLDLTNGVTAKFAVIEGTSGELVLNVFISRKDGE